MNRTIDIDLAPMAEAGWLIAPRPFDHWGQRFDRFEADGVAELREIGALNSECRAYLIRAEAGAAVRLRYVVREAPEAPAPDWVWEVQKNRYTQASAALTEQAVSLARHASTEAEALRRIVDEAAAMFGYDHPEDRFNDGCDEVPSLCGTTKGSCVDINTFILAAALSLGLRGQYIAGYWFHPEKTATLDMHCWLAFSVDGRLAYWDVAHCLKWADTLGATLGEGLNPAGGRRVAMSCGRGLRFETPLGVTEISHFSEPYRLRDDGAAIRGAFGPIRLTETRDGADRAAPPAKTITTSTDLETVQ